jgi:hypothetical protein
MLTKEIVTSPSTAVSVPPCIALDPTWTVPKSILAGSTVSQPVSAPTPASCNLNIGLETPATSETNEMVPLLLPRDRGAKTPLNVKLSPLARVNGKSSPLRTKSFPCVMTCDNVTFELPQLVMVTACNFRRPTATLPNSRFAGVRNKEPVLLLDEVNWLVIASAARAHGAGARRIAITAAESRDRKITRGSCMARLLRFIE